LSIKYRYRGECDLSTIDDRSALLHLYRDDWIIPASQNEIEFFASSF
jgi:hypothetical protein